ncbi:MAG: CapA family protein [Gemmatimonadota bacterium]
MSRAELQLFLCGDVMLGRGVDQIQRHRSDPRLYEANVTSALGYVDLAEQASGPIPRGVAPDYVWGDALIEFARLRPDVRIINLETAVTTCAEPWPGKGIHYRMHPANAGVLRAAGIDCCVLANNHVLDWSRAGLVDTLDALRTAGIRTAGAGRDAEEAAQPAIIEAADGARVLVFAFATLDCGTQPDWSATTTHAGIALLPSLAAPEVRTIAARVRAARQPGDIVVASIHWGGNWGYAVPPPQRAFAHALIDEARVDIVHGHSSHHPKGLEVHGGRLILYGCGDFINDYEGIGGYEEFRTGLGLMYFATLATADGSLARLQMTPTRVRRFRVERAGLDDAQWLRTALDRECGKLGAGIRQAADGTLLLAR